MRGLPEKRFRNSGREMEKQLYKQRQMIRVDRGTHIDYNETKILFQALDMYLKFVDSLTSRW